MHPPDDQDCPFRDVVLEAISELEETKIKFSDAIEQVRHCESKLNHALNVMLKCRQLIGTSFRSRHGIKKGIVESTNIIVNDVNLDETTQQESLENISQNIKTEPPDRDESENFITSVTLDSTLLSSRKRLSFSNFHAADGHIKEEPSKRRRNNTSPLQDIQDDSVLDVSKTEPVRENEIIAGSVVPVLDNNPIKNLVVEPRKGPDFLVNKCPVLSTDGLFSQLSGIVCQRTLDAVKALGFTRMTEVQARVIQPMSSGRNMWVSSRRGSGKTLAFLIPAIEILYRSNFRPCDGIGCVILCLTNELVMQTYGVLMGLMQYHQLTYGMLLQSQVGQTRVFPSESVTSQGVNILVTTPTKLLECLYSRSENVHKFQCLIIDDSDLVLSLNMNAMEKIFDFLSSHNQIALFTANEISYSPNLDKLLGSSTLYISVRNKEKCLISEGIKHYYVNCGAVKRTFLIFKILKEWHANEKVVVVFRKAFHVNYFRCLLPMLGIPVYAISERYGSEDQTSTFLSFCSAKIGVLLCCSLLTVGLDIPAVSWVIQFDCPSVEEYIRCAGLTARGLNGEGKSLMLLYPSQNKFFLRVFEEHGISVREYTSVNVRTGLKDFQEKLQVFIENGDPSLKKFAQRTAGSCLGIFNHRPPNRSQKRLLSIAKSFGLTEAPTFWSNPKEKTKPKKQILKKKCVSKKQKNTLKSFKGTAQFSHH